MSADQPLPEAPGPAAGQVGRRCVIIRRQRGQAPRVVWTGASRQLARESLPGVRERLGREGAQYHIMAL